MTAEEIEEGLGAAPAVGSLLSRPCSRRAVMDVSEDIARALADLPARVEASATLRMRGQWVTCDFMIEVSGTPFYATLDHGRLRAFDRGPLLMRPWTFAIRGDEASWREFWQPIPRPTFHDIFALAKCKGFVIEGDVRPLMTNLLFFKELLAVPRGSIAEAV